MKLEDGQRDWRVHRHEVILQRSKVLSLVVAESTLIISWFLDDGSETPIKCTSASGVGGSEMSASCHPTCEH